MAVFGFNLTLSLLGVFFLRKLIPVFDLPSRFLTGFYRFYAPSEKDCREAANKPEKIIKDKKKKQAEQKEFIIPKNADVPLYFAPVKPDDFCFLHFYSEFCWLVEFSLCTLMIYFVSLIPDRFKWSGESVPDELNLSNIWLILGALFCGINLSRLSSRYLGSSGERSLLVMFGTFCFVGCLSALTLPSRIVELGFEEMIESLERVSRLGITLIIALFSAFFGSAFAFPGFRTAQMNRDSSSNADGPITKLLLHGAFYSPLLVPLTFYPKLFRGQLKEPTNDIQLPWLPGALDDVMVDRIQVGIILFTSLWKISMWKSHLQAYLAVAKNRIDKLRKREKQYSQVDVAKNVTVVWYYSLVAVLQYLLPSMLLIFLSLLLKSASGLTWYGPVKAGWDNPAGLENLPSGSWTVLLRYLIWLVSSAQALSVVGGYAFHSIIDTDL